MRQLCVSFVVWIALVAVADAQDNSGGLRGVYGSTPAGGGLQGVYGPGQSAPPPTAPSGGAALSNADVAPRGPNVSLPGFVNPGQRLPASVTPVPLPGQPSYGAVMVNGRRAIVERGTNRVIRYDEQ